MAIWLAAYKDGTWVEQMREKDELGRTCYLRKVHRLTTSNRFRSVLSLAGGADYDRRVLSGHSSATEGPDDACIYILAKLNLEFAVWHDGPLTPWPKDVEPSRKYFAYPRDSYTVNIETVSYTHLRAHET